MSQIENIKKLHQQGQFEEAIKGYQSLIAAEPNNDEAHFGMAHACSRMNNLEVALKHAQEAVNLAPNSDRYQQFKGQMLMANGKLDDSLKAFKRSLKENPNLFFSYLAIADIYAIKNDSNKAKENYKLALKVHKDGIPAITKLAKLLLLEGNYDEAEDMLQQAELQFPTDPNVKLHMGILRLEQGEDGFAELYFKKLLEDEPNNAVAKAYLSISLQHSNPEQATVLITEMLNQKVQIPELMAALGIWHANTNNHQEAIKYLTPICQSGLAYPSWMLSLAQASVGNLQPNTAMGVLNEVLKRGENSRALLMLGQIHQINNNFPAAIKSYRRIKQGDRFFQEAQLMQAECHYSAANFDAVIKILDDVLTNNANHSTAIKLKLNTLSQQGKIDDALAIIESIDDSKQSASFNQLMHLYSGLLLDEKQDYEQAWQHFSVLEHPQPQTIEILNKADEKAIQALSAPPANSVFRFVFTDPATGHHDFLNWLLQNEVTPLIDRFTQKSRSDVFSQKWTVQMLNDLNEGQMHLWRKKYTKQLNFALQNDPDVVVDFLPFTPINVAIIKRIFPQAHVLVLSRNIADLRLHNQVFGSHQVHYSHFSKVANQMIAMNPNVAVVDVDAWQAGDELAVENIHKVFGADVSSFKMAKVTPLDRLMFPFMHWKNYQKQLNTST